MARSRCGESVFEKKPGGKKKKGRKRKSATGFNYRCVSLVLTVIHGGGRGLDIIPGGISLKRAHPARNVSWKRRTPRPVCSTRPTHCRDFSSVHGIHWISLYDAFLRSAPRRILSLALSFLTYKTCVFVSIGSIAVTRLWNKILLEGFA